jgi:hypothetical protein
LPLLQDKTLGILITEDANASISYAECQAKQAGIVGLYNSSRQQSLDYVATLKKGK